VEGVDHYPLKKAGQQTFSVFYVLYQLSYTRIKQTYSGGGTRTRDCIEVSLYYGTCKITKFGSNKRIGDGGIVLPTRTAQPCSIFVNYAGPPPSLVTK